VKYFLYFLVCWWLFVVPLAATADEGIITHRQGIFTIAHGHLLGLKSILVLKHGNPDDIRYHAEGIRTAYDHLGDAFPNGSDGGETRAKSTVWSERSKFDQLMNESDDAATAMVTSVREGDNKQQITAFKKLAGSCKECHDDFREK
jgi:cytochrome c556